MGVGGGGGGERGVETVRQRGRETEGVERETEGKGERHQTLNVRKTMGKVQGGGERKEKMRKKREKRDGTGLEVESKFHLSGRELATEASLSCLSSP